MRRVIAMKYRYHLLKYKGKESRLTCPQCGRKHCFAPYVDDNEQIVSTEYGRCNHESSCAYFQYPPSDSQWWRDNEEKRKQQYRSASQSLKKHQLLTDNLIVIC